MQDKVQEPLVGTLVDQRYQVLSKVARGGMATVYLATDLRLDREVALKVLHPRLSMDDSFLDRLGREAKAAARLSHPHVVGVLDQGEELRDGHQLAYLVMEYIPGHTLRDVLNDHGALSPRLALAYLDAVVEGLAAAHRAGLVHRDVKPENVLIADDGRIKVGDFGLARAVTTSTSTGTLIGTVAYLSPELVMGKPSDARSDIYAAGIMLFELLTGEQPFRGEVPIQVAYQHVNSVVPPPSSVLPGLAPDLDELVRWCTESDPEDRPHDANALLGELRHIRTSLTDAQLDFSGDPNRTAAVPAPPSFPPSSAGLTEALSSAAQPTEIFTGPPAPQATTIMDRQVNPTTMMERPAPLTVDTEDAPRISARAAKSAQKKSDKAAAREAARNASTPVTTLRKGNSRRKGMIWLVLVLILILLGATAGWFFGLGPGALATVPDLKDKTVAEAQAELSKLGFNSTTQAIDDETIVQDHVVSSQPAAQSQQRKFLSVVLLVSHGPTLYAVPAMVGGSLDAAKSALNSAHMALGAVTQQYEEQIPAGQVLSQDPAANVQKRAATPINLLVSQGPKPLPVPAVVGQTQEAAVKALTDAGLTPVVATDQVNDAKVSAGSIVSQDPATGTLSKGGKVNLVVSKGPKMVNVPSFIGKQVDQAVEELKRLNLPYKINEILGGFFGTVRAQDPVNVSVPEGTTINLTVV
ncbi:serine/threonine protein kinase [Renibacterium salmoninarum ATCC 33209]|uniref:non-specific serine/threonine protein kinase n=1 Tax=Renibacterium salmoninarum (strain ATCC 33209 / DSM 20767 / JCM 11484 / NBRC 15589 / NCIMB 2235) TaxID=288705 RepID=A9WRF6_RENSM|nr:PASTA domain-containing protein [Renibacterium salmoninarum]ABY24238.1 serine/threonine protein kinase [Renibacterium salmoninarum ATCC 33209]